MADKSCKLHIAWTVDDGPTKFTRTMVDAFDSAGKKKIPATWFIQRDRLTQEYMTLYKELQNKGHEIGIHGLHLKRNHLSWFPTDDRDSYDSIDRASEDLGGFHNYLYKNGIISKFVRLPYGLLTELSEYSKKAISDEISRKESERSQMKKDASDQIQQEIGQLNKLRSGKIARKVISNQISSQGKEPSNQVARSFNQLKKELGELGLYLWGGSDNGAISVQSWEAESAAPGTGRTDNVPLGQIKMMKHILPNRPSKSGSFVILCHDTTKGDVSEVRRDIKEMEDAAKKYDTEIVYHSMSGLFGQKGLGTTQK